MNAGGHGTNGEKYSEVSLSCKFLKPAIEKENAMRMYLDMYGIDEAVSKSLQERIRNAANVQEFTAVLHEAAQVGTNFILENHVRKE